MKGQECAKYTLQTGKPECLIIGGESGSKPREFDVRWAYDSLNWADANRVKFWMKQIGAMPVDSLGKMRGAMFSAMDKRGSRLESLPMGLRVREVPDWWKGMPL